MRRSLTFMSYDLVIRNGTVVDGLGGDPYRGDVAVSGGVIAALGVVEGAGAREIDATGMLVTPASSTCIRTTTVRRSGRTDVSPSSSHGVTTALMGNCGVGFAPCPPATTTCSSM